MLSKIEIQIAMQVLKQGRFDMVQDFLNHQPDIYAPSFKYEESPALLKFARDKYVVSWLSNHWQLFINHAALIDTQQDIDVFFASVFLELLEKWKIVASHDSSQLHLGISLVKDMEKTLIEFIKVGEKTDTMRNTLALAMDKNRVLFDRMMRRLEQEESEYGHI